MKASNKSRARCWRLTWLAGPGRKVPSWEFIEREPEPKTKARKRMERGQKALKTFRRARDSGKLAVLDSDTLSPFHAEMATRPVLESNTPNHKNGSLQPNHSVPDSATHIAIPWGLGATDSLIGWWQPDWSPAISIWIVGALISARNAHKMRERKAA